MKYVIAPGQEIDIKDVVTKKGSESFTGVIDAYFHPEVEIGNYTSIASPLYVHGATEHPCVFDRKLVSTYPFGDKWNIDYPKASSKGNISIGNDVWIGESVTLLSGVHIGDGAIIGARSVIVRNVEPYAVVVGNPAIVVRFRFTPDIIKKLLKIRWWDWPRKQVERNLRLMKDISKFIEVYG